MTRWTSRITILTVFVLLAILMVEKDDTTFKTQVRVSRYRDSTKNIINMPHVGKLS